ncbi:NAD(P)/FAD-dependent oxidoreductase [Paenibacillus aestuarii]|uniref:NAD(P)/FAD-dependent oxidoreductase n=1 Tax=Paenibacillus aestuarii TaxID=516965 RepID=A0ABW0KDL8_9BACL|nr:NAD(P)/FAD-dependent oxidoreductase [Paenibacillus aestuarii]
MNQIRDVAILGAGIAGSSLAKTLADRGWDTVLIDRKQFPRHKVCGEFLSPESQSMLKELGLSNQVELLQPYSITRARLLFNFGNPLEIPLTGVALGLSRYSLDATLHQAASNAGVNILTSTTVTSVNPHGSGFTIETKQGEERQSYRARAVIAAWGSNGHAGLPGHHSNGHVKHAYVGIKSHFVGIDAEPVVELYFFDGGYVGVSPVEGGIVNVAALLKRDRFTSSSDKSVLGWIEAARRRHPKLNQKLANATPVPGTQAAVAPVVLNRKPLTWEMIPQVGDAAVMIPPLCGDGMSMALRSALLCAPLANRFLSGEISLQDWRQQYTQAVRREFSGPFQWGQLFQWLFQAPVLPRLFLGIAPLAPGLVTKFVQATRLKESDV